MRKGMSRLSVLAIIAALMSGCGGEQLSQTWQLDRLRILGAKATLQSLGQVIPSSLNHSIYTD